MNKKMIIKPGLVIFGIAVFSLVLVLTIPCQAAGNPSALRNGTNPHYLSVREYNAWRILIAKIDNEIDALHRRINVLKDLQNRRAKPEEVQAMAAAIRSSIDEIFNEVNSEMADRKLFKDDSKAFMGKLEAVRRSLENLGV